MTYLRAYLLVGMIAHKVLWEIMKRRPTGTAAPPAAGKSFGVRVVKTAKKVLLLALIAQTLLPEILPIVSEPEWLRNIGVSIYTLGLSLAVLGRIQLGDNWLDIEDGSVLAGQRVQSSGVYRYLRHPIYTGDLLLLFGLELSLNSWLVLGVPVLTLVVLRQAMQEERKLLRDLPGYDAYAMSTKRFIPFVY